MSARDSGFVRVGPAGLDSALRTFKKHIIPVHAELKRRAYYLSPSAKRRQKRERNAARLRKQARRRAAASFPMMPDD